MWAKESHTETSLHPYAKETMARHCGFELTFMYTISNQNSQIKNSISDKNSNINLTYKSNKFEARQKGKAIIRVEEYDLRLITVRL